MCLETDACHFLPPTKQISDFDGVCHSELSSYIAHQLFTAEEENGKECCFNILYHLRMCHRVGH